MKKHLDGVYIDYYFNTLEKINYTKSQEDHLMVMGKVIESKKNKVKLEVEGLEWLYSQKRLLNLNLRTNL